MTSLATSDRATPANPYSRKPGGLAQGALQSQHYYLYDPILEDRKMANTLAGIETSLMSLEIHGRIGRLGPLKSAKEMIKTAMKQGVKTVVVVGSDKSIAEVINAAAGEKITLGIIPIGRSAIAEMLGIPEGQAACEIVAARRLQMFDLGRANNTLFFRQAVITGRQVTVTGDELWHITSEKNSTNLSVVNAGPVGSPFDGQMELVIDTGTGGWWQNASRPSVIPLRQAHIEGKDGGQLILDDSLSLNLPVTIEVIPQALKIIIGKTILAAT